MKLNFIIIGLASLIPLVIGFIWYNPKVLGTIWMKESGMTEEKAQGANMPLIFGVTFILSFLAALGLNSAVIHQTHVFSILLNEPGFFEPGSEINTYYTDFMTKYGNNFRTFRHGVIHGGILGFLIALPVLGVNALFERKSFKYIALNVCYWIVCFMLMGGVICQFA